MIFKAENINGWYKIAGEEVRDEEDNVSIVYWDLPETQTISWGMDGDKNIIFWPSYPKNQLERFLTCDEFVAKNKAHMLAVSLETARKCIVVTDTEGVKSTLDEYIKSGKDPELIVDAPDLADYYRAPNEN